MLIRADVKCYYCGFVSGHLEGDPQSPRAQWSFHPSSDAAPGSRQRGRQIRCGRCGGPVYLDDFESVRLALHVPAVA